jgi:hypothetical protein
MLAAVGAAVALAIALGAGAPRPEIDLVARRTVIDRAHAAEAALAVLRERLAGALEDARTGAARVVAGEEAPGPLFDEAAGEILEAVDAAVEAEATRESLAAARDAQAPDAAALPLAPDAAEVASLGGQLGATAAAADDFAARRVRAESVTRTLLDALDALEAGEVDEADRLVAEAHATVDVLSAWEIGADSLPTWVETVDEMIGAMERLVSATREGDVAAAERAAAAIAALAEDAPAGDRALRIAVGEGGTAVAATPLGRLAALLAAIDELHLAVVAARQAAGG